MVRTVFVNGEYLPETEGKISIFDRGFLFADGVYEVSAVINGKLVDYAAHMERLGRSLKELRMAWPCTREELDAMHQELIKRNNLAEGIIAAVKEVDVKVPVVVRLEGTNVELGKKLLAESGLNIIAAADMADGAKKAVAAAGGSK